MDGMPRALAVVGAVFAGAIAMTGVAAADGPVEIRSRSGDACLDAPSDAWPTHVVVNPCNGANFQRWNVTGDQRLERVRPFPGKCLNRPQDIGALHLVSCWNSQHWSIQPDGHITAALGGCLHRPRRSGSRHRGRQPNLWWWPGAGLGQRSLTAIREPRARLRIFAGGPTIRLAQPAAAECRGLPERRNPNVKARILKTAVGGAAAALAAGVTWAAPSASAGSDFCNSLSTPAQVRDCSCGADNVPRYSRNISSACIRMRPRPDRPSHHQPPQPPDPRGLTGT